MHVRTHHSIKCKRLLLACTNKSTILAIATLRLCGVCGVGRNVPPSPEKNGLPGCYSEFGVGDDYDDLEVCLIDL